MPLKIMIGEGVKKSNAVWIERTINDLLKYIPEDHLVGISHVNIVGGNDGKSQKASVASYYPKKNRSHKAFIQICPDLLLTGKDRLLGFFLPNARKHALAQVLFHEIGHHIHFAFKHGKKKPNWEAFADKYSKNLTMEVAREIITRNWMTKTWCRLVIFFYNKCK